MLMGLGRHINFRLWHQPTGLLSPCSLAVVILVKCGLVMGDENKNKMVGHQALGNHSGMEVHAHHRLIGGSTYHKSFTA
jgi:hypothetical protein